MQMYVIYDRVAEESGPIFEAKNDAVACRKWREFQRNSPVSDKEFKLLSLGCIDHATNKIIVYEDIKELDPIAASNQVVENE